MYLAQSTNWGHFLGRIGIQKCWFFRRENWNTRRKISWSKDVNQQQTQPTRRRVREFEPHWWEASALTTAPSLLALLKKIALGRK